MKLFKHNNLKNTGLAALVSVIFFTSCERDLSDDATLATFPTTAAIFTDTPVGLTDQFFRSFDPAAGANTNGFGVDDNVSYQGTSSIRIDVPASNDPDGGFIGGIFEDRGAGRDLTGYDALTFWAKGTTSGVVQVGFGTDFDRPESEPSYEVSTTIAMTSGWKKYIIPIPDASNLVQERGLFLFSAGGFDPLGDGPNGNELAWTFWMDELRFENLGTTQLLYPYILNQEDIEIDSFEGFTQQLSGLGATFNLANGDNISVIASPDYFDFNSSDSLVATVNESGLVTVDGSGTTTVSATLAGNQARGSLTINSSGGFVNADDPTLPEADVISIFSDTYSDIAGFNPGVFAGSNIGTISTPDFGGNSHISYASIDFVGLGWDGTVDASGETMVHLDVQLTTGAGGNVVMELIDFGPDGIDNGFAGSDGTAGGNNISSQLIPNQWVGLDIPLSAFNLPTGGGGAGNPNLNNLGFIVFVSNNGAGILVDNIYFY